MGIQDEIYRIQQADLLELISILKRIYIDLENIDTMISIELKAVYDRLVILQKSNISNSQAAQILRAIKSEKRSETSRINGRKGGRPNKKHYIKIK